MPVIRPGRSPGRRIGRLEDGQLEDVVVDKPLAGRVLAELEGLGVAKRLGLLVDLGTGRVSMHVRTMPTSRRDRGERTLSCPVTRMMMPPLGVGCAWGSANSCLTVRNGRLCKQS